MDKQVLKEKVKSLESFNHCTRTDFEWGFDVCRHEVLSLIQALDEPQKVKVPAFVAEWIEYVKKKGDSFFDSFSPWDLYGAEYIEADRWIAKNGEIYGRAWLDGYEVEEEPKWVVKVDDNAYFVDFFDSLTPHLVDGLGWEVMRLDDKSKADAVALIIGGKAEKA